MKYLVERRFNNNYLRMKKIALFSLLTAVFLAGCKKEGGDKNRDTSVTTFYVDIFESCCDGLVLPAELSTAILYKDTGKEVDIQASAVSIKKERHMTYADGTVSNTFDYMSNGAKNEFENIPNGKYMLWVYYSPQDNSHITSVYVDLKPDFHKKRLKKVFESSSNYGYQPWD